MGKEGENREDREETLAVMGKEVMAERVVANPAAG